MHSGTQVKTVAPIVNDNGARIAPGTECMVLGVARCQSPAIYVVETNENPEFEQETFFCFKDQLEVA